MISILLKLGGLQAFLLAVFLLKKRTNNTANNILALLLLTLGVSCFFYSFNSLEFYLKFPHLIRADWGIPLLFGPLIYTYTQLLTNKTRWNKELLVIFTPYIINLIVLFPFFIKSAEKKIQILDYFTASITTGTDYYLYYSHGLNIVIAIISITYADMSIKTLITYKRNLLYEFSNTEKLKLDWLRILLYSFMILSLVFVILYILKINDRYPQFDYTVYYYFAIFIFIYILTYKTLSLPQITIADNNISESKVENISTPSKTLSEEAIRLKNYMITEKPFLNGELTATVLSESLNMTRHQISRILNEEIGSNFYDFVNQYRVEEFKERISAKENDHLTLLAIAYDSGFNSKTTFNTFFKKVTGITPSAYKKSLK